MKDELSSQQSRALAIALLLLSVGCIYFLLVEPALRQYRASQDTIEQLSINLATYERAARRLPVLKEKLQLISPERYEEKYYLRSGTEAFAFAELQAYLNEIVEEADGSLVSSQPLDSEAFENVRMIRANMRMRGNIEIIQRVFYAIEAGSPLLLIDNVSIATQRSDRRQKHKLPSGTMDVYFNLIGFIREQASNASVSHRKGEDGGAGSD